MRDFRHLACLFVAVLVSAAGSSPRQGAVTAVTLSPAAAEAGATVTATVTGSSGGCGAVHINWGDGTAITYATSTLPVTQTHVYKVGGTFNVRAQGMGNCTGEATARIVITAPPPPALAPRLTAVALSAPSIEARTAAAITLEGTGACRLTVDFGDGNNQQVNTTLPTTLRHTYPRPGRYAIVATPAAPCAERREAILEVVERQTARITGLKIESQPQAPTARSITVLGSGRCSYVLDFGDGNTEARDATLPELVHHHYPAAGRYTVVATARTPCSGAQRSAFSTAGEPPRGEISRVDVRPQLARAGDRISVNVAGSGTCRFVVDFGDGESRTLTERLPHRLVYRYAQAGNYEIVIRTEAPCTGGGDALLRVLGR